VWNTNARNATHILLLRAHRRARSEEALKNLTLSHEFDRAKITVQEIEKARPRRRRQQRDLHHGLEIPEDNVVGEVGSGFYHILDSLNRSV